MEPQSAHSALRELFLRPSSATQHRGAPQPRIANKLAHCVEPLRCTPSQLATYHLCRAHHASGTRARTCREAHTAKGVGERAHLFISRRVRKLRFSDRLAPAHEPAVLATV